MGKEEEAILLCTVLRFVSLFSDEFAFYVTVYMQFGIMFLLCLVLRRSLALDI